MADSINKKFWGKVLKNEFDEYGACYETAHEY